MARRIGGSGVVIGRNRNQSEGKPLGLRIASTNVIDPCYGDCSNLNTPSVTPLNMAAMGVTETFGDCSNFNNRRRPSIPEGFMSGESLVLRYNLICLLFGLFIMVMCLVHSVSVAITG